MSLYSDLLLQEAVAALGAGRLEEADNALRLVVGSSGNDGYVLYVIGHLNYLRGRLEDAEWFLTHALAIDPKLARAHNDLGETLRALGRNADALPHLQQAVALEPSLAHAYGNLAAVLVALNRPDEALRWAQESLWRADDKMVAHCDLGSIFGRLNRVREAIRQYDLALELRPGDARAYHFRGMMRLSLGQMPDGWLEHEGRLHVFGPGGGARDFPQPRWSGAEDIGGRTILLHAEQGYGDTIQFVRYATLLAERGAVVWLEVQAGLGGLCATVPGVTRVFEQGDTLPDFDFHCAMMSLPAAFRTTLDTIPATVPYLTAAAALPHGKKPRIGLAWSGSPRHADDPNRSMPLAALSSLLNRTEVEWHVLQRDINDTDRADMAAFPGLIDHSGALTDFAVTAGLVASMNCVVSVDTAVAHLAGALNVPVRLMLARAADWRWMQDRADTPWYPNTRLFRQRKRGDWGPVIEAVDRDLVS